MNNIHVIIPMAGLGSRFSDFGFKTPKFLLPVDESNSMIKLAVSTLNAPKNTTYSFITLSSIFSPKLEEELNEYNADWTILDKLSEGPASTVMACLDKVPENTPLLVSNSDQILKNWDCKNFLTECKGYNGGILTYIPNYNLQMGSKDKHSFVELKNGECIRFAEKIVLSDQALVGVHYFASKQIFRDAYQKMVETNTKAPNGEYYLSLLYNFIDKVKAVPMKESEVFYPTGEPTDYFKYLNEVTHFGVKKMTEFIINKNGLIVSLVDAVDTEENKCSDYIYGCPEKNIISKGNSNMTGKLIKIYHPDIQSCPNGKSLPLSDSVRGWVIGNFTPSLLRTKKFEVGILSHKKGEKWPFHIHDELCEYNYIYSGKMLINGLEFKTGDSFMFEKGHPAIPIFTEDCTIICVKVPSVPKDKKII